MIDLHHSDCIEWLRAYDGPLFDSCVTDPPYHLSSIVKRFGGANAAEAKVGATGAYARASRGFMGKEWDGGDVAFRPETWRAVYDALKPGAHLVAFSGTRNYHRMACAIEDAGFEIRDCLMWTYGSGFPKSHDVSKGIDRAAGAEREVVSERRTGWSGTLGGKGALCGLGDAEDVRTITAPATPDAAKWQGWGTALKPSHEPVCLAQKPYTFEQEWVTIRHLIERLWSALWLTLPANDVEQFSTLNPSAYGVDPSAFAQWIAGQRSNTRAALSGQTDMLQSGSALISSLNTVSSWNSTLAASFQAENTSTIGTASNLTIDLRTLRFCLSQITPANIILAHKQGRWSNADACNAGRLFSASVAMLNATLELSAIENATDWVPVSCPDVGEITPSLEPICLARKPLSEKSVAANVLKHGTGAINVDACRVDSEKPTGWAGAGAGGNTWNETNMGLGKDGEPRPVQGRWPANLIHDGSDEVQAGFPDTGAAKASERGLQHSGRHGRLADIGGNIKAGTDGERGHDDNGGSAARFFYSAKAGPLDRIGTSHATVKPVDVMRWLCRLVTPPGGRILEPFAGSGTTGIAAMAEGFDCTMLELMAEHVTDIERKLAYLRGEGAMSFVEHDRRRDEQPAQDSGPLFAGAVA